MEDQTSNDVDIIINVIGRIEWSLNGEVKEIYLQFHLAPLFFSQYAPLAGGTPSTGQEWQREWQVIRYS